MAEFFADGHLRFIDGTWCDDNGDVVDIKEVKHGYWRGKPITRLCTVDCSVCGMAFSENSGRWLYCPNCGAKMDGKLI